MMRPRTSVLVIGHPLVAAPLVLLHAGVGAVCAYNAGFNLFSVYVLCLLGWVGNCYNEAARYRAWRREWDALDPDYTPPKRLRRIGRQAFTLLAAGAAYWLVTNFNDPESPARLIAFTLPVALLALGLFRIVFRRRKRGTPPQDWVVTQAIQRPLPAPPVADAYARLPDYCRPLFSSEPARKEQS